jgi:hypothetical protein
LLKLGRLSTRAGRFFAPGRSLKGNGTTTTSHASEITKRLVVVDGTPFLESLGNSGVIRGVEWLRSSQDRLVVLHLVDNEVAGFQMKRRNGFRGEW